MSSIDFNGKVVLVSAGTAGIGQEIVNQLADQGANIVTFSRSATPGKAVFPGGNALITLQADAANSVQLAEVVDTTLENFGRIDVLINNAGGVPYFGPMLGADLAAFDSFFDINLRTTFALTQLVVQKWMDANGGSIVNIAKSCRAAERATGLGIYRVAKAGLVMFTQQLARELSGKNIRVNAIAPGYIKTEFSRQIWENPQSYAALVELNPSKRIGTAEDVANATLFVASDSASYINGEVLVVDGGAIA